MLRHLLICRHAEAAFPSLNQPDFERPLTSLGIRQAGQTGRWLKDINPGVDLLISSPATRTRQTSEALKEASAMKELAIQYESAVYEAPASRLLLLLSHLNPAVKGVVLVGHNPGVSSLCSQLCDLWDLRLEVANGVYIQLDLDSWEDIHFTKGTCVAHYRLN
jgi:phosphohistidine phosphatase